MILSFDLTALQCQLPVLHINFFQGLNVLRYEADRHRQQPLCGVALLAQSLDRVIRVGLEPLHGAHSALVG